MAKHHDANSEARSDLFEIGRNCWRVEHATRAAFLVDGDDYFNAFVAAARKAQRSILIVGWDFHSRTRLTCSADSRQPELHLGDFLNDLVQHRRDLHVHILIWDYPMIFGMDREWAPIYGLGWQPRRRVHFRYDNTHPVGGSHHQKIVVIDDALAFNGGIDLTSRRWDTCEHAADDLRRVAQGTPYPPFHDLMMMVEGGAAAALGDLVRMRWRLATGEVLQPVAARRSRWPRRMWRSRAAAPTTPWPDTVWANVENVRVAVSRTAPASEKQEAVREVEALYVDMIARARRTIYMENQYFTADRIGDALEARLHELDGPEIVVVVRKLSRGWLEELSMESLRSLLVARLREADRHGRLTVVYPHIDGLEPDSCIDVHSKMMIVDDELVRIGSSNIANRSMGLDTECDLTVDCDGRDDVRRAIRMLRATLLAEHLGSTPRLVQETIERTGSLRATIVGLRQDSRTLKPLEDLPQVSAGLIQVANVVDPEKPVALADLMKIFSSGAGEAGQWVEPGPAWGKIVAMAMVLAALTALWQLTPLSQLLDADRITVWAEEFADQWWGPLVTVLAYTPAVITMFPRSPITLFAVIAFGPWLGFLYAMLGAELAAGLTFMAGKQLDRNTVRRIAGARLNDMIQVLRRRGLLAITALRLVPLAPFSVESAVAGAVGVNAWHFMLGSAIGILPGVLASTIFGDQLHDALKDPATINYWLLAAVIVVMAAATLAVRRWLMLSAAGAAASHYPETPHGPASARTT